MKLNKLSMGTIGVVVISAMLACGSKPLTESESQTEIIESVETENKETEITGSESIEAETKKQNETKAAEKEKESEKQSKKESSQKASKEKDKVVEASKTQSSKGKEKPSKSEVQATVPKKEEDGNQASQKPQTQTQAPQQQTQVPQQPQTPQKPQQQETQAPHVHNWVKQTQIVHHDAVIQQVWIEDSAAWDEPVYECRTLCNGCDADITGNIDHIYECGPGSYRAEEILTGTVHHEATGHYEDQVVQPAYDETVVTGYVCSGCGAIK